MKPSQILAALATLLDIRQPAFLWGAPGVGKSQVVAQAAAERGLELIDVRAVLLDPVDLRGLPRIDAQAGAVWCPPAFLPRSGRGVLFLDELNTAPPLVQAACYQLILDRKLGEYRLPEGWTVLAAGNRESDRAITHRMPSALANRLVHLDFEPDLDDWLAWAEGAGIDPRLLAFLRFRPKLLHAHDPQSSEKAFPSPRSWEFAARILAARPGQEVLADLLRGAVGEAAALECLGYLAICAELPETEAVLADPGGVRIPEEPAAIYALCESVARKASDSTMPSLALLAGRLPVEFGVLLMRDAAATEPSIVETEAFQGWACANSDVLVR
jgi:MoxR-like ATPase